MHLPSHVMFPTISGYFVLRLLLTLLSRCRLWYLLLSSWFLLTIHRSFLGPGNFDFESSNYCCYSVLFFFFLKAYGSICLTFFFIKKNPSPSLTFNLYYQNQAQTQWQLTSNMLYPTLNFLCLIFWLESSQRNGLFWFQLLGFFLTIQFRLLLCLESMECSTGWSSCSFSNG